MINSIKRFYFKESGGKIGTVNCTGIETATADETNAIFDIDNYGIIYRQNLSSASKEVVISSPDLGRDKVHQMIKQSFGNKNCLASIYSKVLSATNTYVKDIYNEIHTTNYRATEQNV